LLLLEDNVKKTPFRNQGTLAQPVNFKHKTNFHENRLICANVTFTAFFAKWFQKDLATYALLVHAIGGWGGGVGRTLLYQYV
jgi:hypothetical protein